MNGHNSHPRVPTPGIWAPAITFFDPETDELDLTSQAKYFTYLSQHLTGLVILGTNAETLMLTRSERSQLLQTARQAVGPNYELMAGVGGHSTKQVLEHISDAAAAKADYILLLPCAYFGKQTTPQVVMNFYDEIAQKSPLPIVIYNFPGVCNGVDIDSDTMIALHRKHPNIVGTKLTCADVGKMTRLAAALDPSAFSVFGGQADFLLAGLSVGSAGAITGFGNVAPKTLKRIYDLFSAGKFAEAVKIQRVSAFAEVIGKPGPAGTKYAVSLTTAKEAGVQGELEEMLRPRRPYEALSAEQKRVVREKIGATVEIERSL